MGALIRWHLFLARHRRVVVLGLALLAAGALWVGSRLKLSEDFTDMLPLSDPVIAEQVEAMRLFRQANRMFFDLGINADNPEGLAEAAEEFCGALQQIPELEDHHFRFTRPISGKPFANSRPNYLRC